MMHTFTAGAMWEQYDWHIDTDCEVNVSDAHPCKHCSAPREKRHYRNGGSYWTEHVMTCPRVVVAFNEGHHNSTGVCLDCILEAATTIAPVSADVSTEGASWAMDEVTQ